MGGVYHFFDPQEKTGQPPQKTGFGGVKMNDFPPVRLQNSEECYQSLQVIYGIDLPPCVFPGDKMNGRRKSFLYVLLSVYPHPGTVNHHMVYFRQFACYVDYRCCNTGSERFDYMNYGHEPIVKGVAPGVNYGFKNQGYQ